MFFKTPSMFLSMFILRSWTCLLFTTCWRLCSWCDTLPCNVLLLLDFNRFHFFSDSLSLFFSLLFLPFCPIFSTLCGTEGSVIVLSIWNVLSIHFIILDTLWEVMILFLISLCFCSHVILSLCAMVLFRLIYWDTLQRICIEESCFWVICFVSSFEI